MIKFQFKVSNSLAMFILSYTLPLYLLLPKMFMTSQVRQIPSLMLLPTINPFFSEEIREGRIEAKLSPRILEMIIKLKLAIAIVLN